MSKVKKTIDPYTGKIPAGEVPPMFSSVHIEMLDAAAVSIRDTAEKVIFQNLCEYRGNRGPADKKPPQSKGKKA